MDTDSDVVTIYLSLGSSANREIDVLEEEARELMYALSEVDGVKQVSALLTTGEPDAKGSTFEWDKLVIEITKAGGLLSALATTLGTWLGRDKNRSLELSIGNNRLHITGISKAEQKELVDWFKLQTGLSLEH